MKYESFIEFVEEKSLRGLHQTDDNEIYATSKGRSNNTVFVHKKLNHPDEIHSIQRLYPYDKLGIHTAKQLKDHKGALSHTTNVFDL